jgi:hypothetical protein
MNKLPTDLKILECIYLMYADTFRNFSREEPSRSAKIYVPIDVEAVASELDTDPHELFGRLYYDLDNRHRYKQDNDSYVHLFAFTIGDDRHCINYPYLAGILAGMRTESYVQRWSLVISLISLGIALAALFTGD